MYGILITIGIIVIIVIWFIASYNGLVRLRNMVRESFATMDVYMKKRYDLIPNLVETVKGYAGHEASTLEKVIAARNAAANAPTLEGRAAGETALTGMLKSVFALAEAYPDLKANTNFMDLQRQLQNVENDIANSRKYYNAVVREYNTKTETFPSVIAASIFGFKHEQSFEIVQGERENIKVQF